MELNANIQLVMNSFETLFPDISLTVNIIPDISLTCFKFPDISRFSRQVVTLKKESMAVGREKRREMTGLEMHVKEILERLETLGLHNAHLGEHFLLLT